MEYLASAPWLVFAFPAALAALIALTRAGKAAPWLALPGTLTVLAVGAASALRGGEAVAVTRSVEWFGGLTLGWHVDGLSAVMLLVVGTVASCVVLFSVGYMHGDRGYTRYFALISLFTAAMSALVTSGSLLAMFVAWELVGLCSYLLIGFWYEKPSAAAAAMKAFLVTRIGDAGFLLALVLLWRQAGTLDLVAVLDKVALMPPAMVTAAALLLFAGAAGKSAQFPLHVWLPDAMEGPTPVSALIHAATMVAAGVFLVSRTWPLFEAAPVARDVVLAVGTITAFGAALAGVAQTDIKKVLAYSTISQLGFMFAALGVGAWEVAMFHLVTHAAFKGLLFLASGSVIHGSGTQDLAEMGGLRKAMPLTAVTWIAGAAALAGVPPLSGFFSKDEIVRSVLSASPVAGVVLLLSAFVTAFYITRATRLAFFGDARGKEHAHESGPTMALPLVVLALLAVGAGAAGAAIARLLGSEPEPLDAAVAALSTLVALAGIAAGWFAYSKGWESEEGLAARFGSVWSAFRAAFGFDGFLKRGVAEPVSAFARATYALVDRKVVDGSVEGLGRLAGKAGEAGAALQTGDGQWYASLIGAGFIVLLAVAALVARYGGA